MSQPSHKLFLENHKLLQEPGIIGTPNLIPSSLLPMIAFPNQNQSTWFPSVLSLTPSPILQFIPQRKKLETFCLLISNSLVSKLVFWWSSIPNLGGITSCTNKKISKQTWQMLYRMMEYYQIERNLRHICYFSHCFTVNVFIKMTFFSRW